MNRKKQTTLVGLFIILSSCLLVAAIVYFGGARFFNHSQNTVIAYFDGSLQGLNEGAPVAYRGVTVGEVRQIRIDFNPDTYQVSIPVLIDLSPDNILSVDPRDHANTYYSNSFLENMRSQGLRASLMSQSLLTGKLYIELAIHENSEPVFRDQEGKYFEIPTVPSELQLMTRSLQSVNFEQLTVTMAQAFMAVEQTTQRIDAFIGETAPGGHQTSLSDLQNSIQQSLGKLDSILAQFDQNLPVIQDKVTTTLETISQFGQDGRQLIQNVDRDLPEIIGTISHAVKTLDTVAEESRLLVQNLEQTTAPNSSLSLQLATTLEELSRSARSLRLLSDYLHHNPDALLWGPKPQGANHGQ